MKKINDLVTAVGGNLQSLVLLFVRLAFGFQLYESGVGHLTHIPKTLDYFRSLEAFGTIHIPFPIVSVYVSGATELVGGVLLMLGLFSRLISVPLLFNFIVAYVTAGWGEIKELVHFQGADDFLNDSALPFLVTALVILAFGPGRIAIDQLIFGKSASD
jgi:putative oxidoreductase